MNFDSFVIKLGDNLEKFFLFLIFGMYRIVEFIIFIIKKLISYTETLIRVIFRKKKYIFIRNRYKV